MELTRFRKGLLLLVLLGLLLSAAGCSLRAELIALALEFWPEYLAYKLKGTSGIPEVDAMLEAKSQLDKIDEADKLVAEGRKEGDITKVEKGIALRPGDWRYKYQAGSMLLEQGDVSRAEYYFREATYGGQNTVEVENPAVAGEERVYPKDQYAIEVLEESRQKMLDRGWKSRAQCEFTYDELIWHYQSVAGMQSPGENKNVDQILAQLESEKARFCPK